MNRSRLLLVALAATAALSGLGAQAAFAAPPQFLYASSTSTTTAIADADVTVFATFAAAPATYTLEVHDPSGALYGTPYPVTVGAGNSSGQAEHVRIGPGYSIWLLKSGDLSPTATDTFAGPMVDTNACAGATAFSGTSYGTSVPQLSLNHALPAAVTSYVSPVFSQTLAAPLARGDVLAVTASWTDADGTTGTASQDFTVDADCPAPAPASTPATGTQPAQAAVPSWSRINVGVALGPMRFSAFDGGAPAKVTVTLPKLAPSLRQDAGSYWFWVARKATPLRGLDDVHVWVPGASNMDAYARSATIPATDIGRPMTVDIGSMLPGDTIYVTYIPPGANGIVSWASGKKDLKQTPFASIRWDGPTIDRGGCLYSSTISGPAPGLDAPMTATVSGAKQLVLLNGTGDRFDVPLLSQWSGEPVVVAADVASAPGATSTFPIAMHSAYTLALPQSDNGLLAGGGVTICGGPGFTPLQTITLTVTTTTRTTSTTTSGKSLIQLIQQGGVTTTFSPPSLGTLWGTIFGPGAWAKTSSAQAAATKQVTLLTAGKVTVKKAGRPMKVRLKLTKQGRAYLKRVVAASRKSGRKTIKLTVATTFDPAMKGLRTVTKRASVSVGVLKATKPVKKKTTKTST